MNQTPPSAATPCAMKTMLSSTAASPPPFEEHCSTENGETKPAALKRLRARCAFARARYAAHGLLAVAGVAALFDTTVPQQPFIKWQANGGLIRYECAPRHLSSRRQKTKVVVCRRMQRTLRSPCFIHSGGRGCDSKPSQTTRKHHQMSAEAKTHSMPKCSSTSRRRACKAAASSVRAATALPECLSAAGGSERQASPPVQQRATNVQRTQHALYANGEMPRHSGRKRQCPPAENRLRRRRCPELRDSKALVIGRTEKNIAVVREEKRRPPSRRRATRPVVQCLPPAVAPRRVRHADAHA